MSFVFVNTIEYLMFAHFILVNEYSDKRSIIGNISEHVVSVTCLFTSEKSSSKKQRIINNLYNSFIGQDNGTFPTKLFCDRRSVVTNF